jgi:acetoin:2,6-dichlorophenolindophenol oxidoreductase subunit alpha
MPQSLPDEALWRLFELMLLMRRFEESVAKMNEQKHFTGHYHLYIGQEATGAPAISQLERRDSLTTTHRNHGHVIARGAEPSLALAEIMGRATGLSAGRGGTIHLTDPALGFLSTSGVVGGSISLGVGGAFARKHRNDGSIHMALFGDSALEEGVAYEALNLAALWKLPVVFLCENNSAESWERSRGGYTTLTHAASDLLRIPQAMGIQTARVDGTDVAEVHAAIAEAIARCRAGNGPVFVEAMTRRWAGSAPLWPELATGVTDLRMATGEAAMSGPHQAWYEQNDPVLKLARALLATSAAVKERLFEIDRKVTARIAAAESFAIASPMPAPETALRHVFA